MTTLTIKNVKGLKVEDQGYLEDLVSIYNSHYTPNRIKERYYEGHIYLSDVNLGIALPQSLAGLEMGCEWGTKSVDILASRSMFDGFVGANGNLSEMMTGISDNNRLVAEYLKACKDELKYGCVFATLSSDDAIGCRIRFHSPETAAARWSGEKGRIDCGLVILDTKKDNNARSWRPARVAIHTDNNVILLVRDKEKWSATYYENPMGRPLMEPMIWNATSNKPFGRSRIKAPDRHLIEGYVRTVCNATIGLEFATTPQKYLLGITDEQYDVLINQKFKQYVGSILAATTNPETGEKPTFGQLSQGSIEPHVQMMRLLATQFSAASGLTVNDVGVINDANPTSSDAILAQSQSLVGLAEQLNAGNADSLRVIARMAQAIARSCRLEDLSEDEKAIIPHFKNPAMPSVAVTADAAIKIASARPGFAQTDIYLEMVGFSQADIRRIKAQEQRTRGLDVFGDLKLNDSRS